MSRLTASSLVITAALGLSLGCGSEADSGRGMPSSSADDCTHYIDAFLERVAACVTATPDERQQAIDECEAGATGDPRASWRAEFAASVDECGRALTCDDYAQNLDDICYPQALAAHASGLISDATNTACVLGGTSDCDAELAMGRETGTSVVASCFRRWSECADQRANGEPYWTEDHCGSLIALPDDDRAAAEPCLELPCTEVAGCLTAAGAFGF